MANMKSNRFESQSIIIGKKDKEHVRDYYCTPPYATEQLLNRIKFKGKVLDPCCGKGEMTKILKKYGHDVSGFDLYFGRKKVDFLPNISSKIISLNNDLISRANQI